MAVELTQEEKDWIVKKMKAEAIEAMVKAEFNVLRQAAYIQYEKDLKTWMDSMPYRPTGRRRPPYKIAEYQLVLNKIDSDEKAEITKRS